MLQATVRHPNSFDLMSSITSKSTALTEKAQASMASTRGKPATALPPSLPPVVIDSSAAGVGLDLKSLWTYRELLYFLIWRDVKVRYKQTALGVLWVILQPLVMMLIFTLLFGKLGNIPSEGIPYSLFAYAGLLPWTFFSGAVSLSSNSVVNSSNLITKIYFPRLIVPIASVGATLVDLAISFGVLAVLMAYRHQAPTVNLLMLPLLVLLLVLVALSFGILMSALNVKYRDVRIALPFLIQVWFFASPVIYPLSLVPSKFRWAMTINPLTGIIDGFRVALYGHRNFDWVSLSISTIVTLILMVCAVYTFRKMERGFADIV